MTQITVDAATAKRLLALEGDVELCDPNGVPLGRFRPETVARAYAEAAALFSEEELNRRDEVEKTFSTDEVIKNLRTRNV